MAKQKKSTSSYETYLAVADAQAAATLANAVSPFTIEIRFLGGLTSRQMDAFTGAANRWVRLIVGDLPNVTIDGTVIDDLLIEAQGVAIDGRGGILGQAGPTRIRPSTAGSAAFLPAKGKMQFDTADLADMERRGTLNDVITHEMGHVLGIGTIWRLKSLLLGAGTTNPRFTGTNARREFGSLRGSGATNVPVENTGGAGTADSHWRESVFFNELMTGFVGTAGNPISRLTAAALQDMGYVVDMSKAEPYALPSLRSLAERGLLVAHSAPLNEGLVLPQIPIVLPDDSLV